MAACGSPQRWNSGDILFISASGGLWIAAALARFAMTDGGLALYYCRHCELAQPARQSTGDALENRRVSDPGGGLWIAAALARFAMTRRRCLIPAGWSSSQSPNLRRGHEFRGQLIYLGGWRLVDRHSAGALRDDGLERGFLPLPSLRAGAAGAAIHRRRS
ncbi:MAG: hypothetical protein KIT00_01840 [Rhodospirillales bacterium]|nr:hypothetical protein [Rhodospirillales bacterium]